jgi:cyclopropane fatty-acyl-phospholipid synthase-like methyltransferase
MASDRYTSGEYAALNEEYHVPDSPWKAAAIHAILQKNKITPRSVCEIGCGAGEIMSQLQLKMPKDIQFAGYDISPHAIDMCKQRENDNLKCVCGDLLAMDTPPYDVLLCIDVFEHVEDYIGFIRQLQPKATYKVFKIPLALSAITLFRSRGLAASRKKLGHLHYYWKDLALMTIDDLGYEIIDWNYLFLKPEKSRTLKLKMLLLPRLILSKFSEDFAVKLLGGAALMVLAK